MYDNFVMLRRFILPVLILTVSTGTLPVYALNPSVHRFETSADGQFMTETIEFQQPASITQGFSYCGQGCSGPDDSLRYCHGGLWIPQFGNDLPRTLTINSPGGATAEKLFLKTGTPLNVPSHYGYWSPERGGSMSEFEMGVGTGAILMKPPIYHENNSLSLEFKSPFDPTISSLFLPDGVCGVIEEVARKFSGKKVDNYTTTRIKVAVVWKLNNPGGIVNTQQTIEVNGSKQTIPASYGTSTVAKSKTDAGVIRDILAKATPSSVTAGLLSKDILNEINLQGYTVDRPTDLGNITARLANGEPAIAWVTTMIDKKQSSGVVLVTGYNGQKDQFQVMYVETGKTSTASYNQFMNQNPGFNFLTKKGAQ